MKAAGNAAAPQTQKWSVILPWVAQLRAVTEVTLALDSTRQPVVFIHVVASKCGDQWRERVVQCREAIELLGMVGAVDNAAWIEMLHRDAGCDNVMVARARGDPVAPRFWVSFNHKKEGEAGVDDAVRFLHFFKDAGERDFCVSEHMKSARQEIIRQCNADMLRKLDAYERFEIDVKLQPPAKQSEDFVREYLVNARRVVDLLAKCAINASSVASEIEQKQATRLVNARGGFPLKPRFVELELSGISLPSGTSVLVAEIAAKGVCLGPGIDFSDEAALGQLEVAELGPVALAMTNQYPVGDGHEIPKRSLVCEGKLRVGYRDIGRLIRRDLATFPSDNYKCEAVLSSFLAARDASYVYMQGVFTMGRQEDVCRKWQWLAYVFFSKESTSSVTNLVIDDMGIFPEDIAAIISILEATNPVKKLLSRHVGGPNDGIEVEDDDTPIAGEAPSDFVSIILSAGTSITINPTDSSQSCPLVLRVDSTFCAIRKDNSRDVIDFLAPGFGHCSVSRASVVQFVITPQPEPSSSLKQGYRGNIKSLELKFMIATDATTFLPLIKYLGPQLEELKLQRSIPVHKQALRTILETCPRLRKLHLPQTEPGFELELLSAYENNSCVISSLKVDAITPTKDTTTFIRALQDPTTSIAATLRHLTLVPGRRVFNKPTASAFLDVLKNNNSLESLTLSLNVPMSKALKEFFRKFDKQLLPVAKTPLPHMCQLAFLSAVRRLRASEEENEDADVRRSTKRRRVGYAIEIDRVDRGVASLIFAFAAERKARSVSICTFKD